MHQRSSSASSAFRKLHNEQLYENVIQSQDESDLIGLENNLKHFEKFIEGQIANAFNDLRKKIQHQQAVNGEVKLD